MGTILNDREVEDLWRLHEASTPPEDMEVFRFPRAVDNVEAVGGLAGWTMPSAVTGAIRPIAPKSPIDEFGEPARETARFRGRYTQLGLILAGDILRDSRGRVWLARQPQEHSDPFPQITAVTERVPDNFVPAILRNGGIPDLPRPQTEESKMKRHTVYGVFVAGESVAIFYTSVHLINALQRAEDFFAIWNGTLMDDECLTIAEDRKSVGVLLPIDPLGNGTDRLVFTAVDGLRLRYLADN